MKEGEKKTKPIQIPIDRDTFINTFFCPTEGSGAMYSVNVDLTFGFIKGENKHRVHIVRVSWEDNDSIVGFDTRENKHVIYDADTHPVEILRGYHNGNIRTTLFNLLSSKLVRLKDLMFNYI